MLYEQKEVDQIRRDDMDKLLRIIVKNNSKCKKCSFYHFDSLGPGCCFFAFSCVLNDFKDFKEKD